MAISRHSTKRQAGLLTYEKQRAQEPDLARRAGASARIARRRPQILRLAMCFGGRSSKGDSAPCPPPRSCLDVAHERVPPCPASAHVPGPVPLCCTRSAVDRVFIIVS
jgi:hypothetical protein